jgi:hypothetical protein
MSTTGITFHGTTGQTLYVRLQVGDTSFIAAEMQEGTNGGRGVYHTNDSGIDIAGMPTDADGEYYFTVRAGSPSTTANDPILGDGILAWQNAASLPRLVRVNTQEVVDSLKLVPTDGLPDVDSPLYDLQLIKAATRSR